MPWTAEYTKEYQRKYRADPERKLKERKRSQLFRDNNSRRIDHAVKLNLNDNEWAYIAGIVDGEGHVAIGLRNISHKGTRQVTSKVSYRALLLIANTNLDLIKWLQLKIGGRIDIKPKKATHKQVYSLRIDTGFRAQEVCRHILPYLIVKKEQALLVLQFPVNAICNQYTVEKTKSISELKQCLYVQSRILNKRGDKDYALEIQQSHFIH